MCILEPGGVAARRRDQVVRVVVAGSIGLCRCHPFGLALTFGLDQPPGVTRSVNGPATRSTVSSLHGRSRRLVNLSSTLSTGLAGRRDCCCAVAATGTSDRHACRPRCD